MLAESRAYLSDGSRRVAWLSAALGCLLLGSSTPDAREPVGKAEPAKKGAFLWIEGEDAKTKNVKAHPWWYDKVKRDKLSGGNWLHHFDEKKEGTAEYELKIPAKGDYHFWIHANPVGAKLSYQLDKDPWTLIDKIDKKARDVVNIAADGKPDLRFVAWIEVGKLDTTQPSYTEVTGLFGSGLRLGFPLADGGAVVEGRRASRSRRRRRKRSSERSVRHL